MAIAMMSNKLMNKGTHQRDDVVRMAMTQVLLKAALTKWGREAEVGAALIKKYSSYRTIQKSSTCFFPKTVAWGPETTPRQVADASPLLADFVDLLLFYHHPKSTPLGIECVSFLCHACDSGFTVARGQHFPVQLRSQNRESLGPRGKNYATLSKIQ